MKMPHKIQSPPPKTFHSFPGNLKISAETWGSMSKQEIENAMITLSLYYQKIGRIFKNNNHIHVSLSLHRVFHIDYKNGKVNFYVLDTTSQKRTQIITKADLEKLEWKERDIFRDIEKYALSKNTDIEHQKNMLEQSLLHTAYKEIQLGHSPPNFLGAGVDDNFDLD